MTHVVLNAVQQIATGTGVGALPLAGATSAQFRTLQVAGIQDGDTTYLRIQNLTNPDAEWEVVLAAYDGGVITRTFDEHSFSATGALINFSEGNKVVTGVVVAGDLMLLSDYADVLGDVVAAADSAYEAQQAELAAEAAGLSARLSQAQNFPPDFIEESKFWTGGQGQASSPTVAANNPLPGTYLSVAGEGQVYQTEATPQTCNSFGPVGIFAGVPGTAIQVQARIRAMTDNTGGTPSAVGVSILHLSSEFNYTTFTPGNGLPTHTVANGWQEVEFTFVVPEVGDPGYSPYYRPSLFYNVVGEATDPLQGSDDPQGNQVFQIAWMRVVVGVFAPLDSPALTGNPTAPTPSTSDSDTSIATTAFVKAQAYAPLASPALTGNPTAPTPATADSDTSIATTAFVKAQAYAPLDSPALTGNPTAPTPSTADSDTSIATTAFVKAQAYAPLASPALTGNPTAPTPAASDNDTSIATTAFVHDNTMLPTIPVIRDITSGATNYVPTTGAKLARVRIKGGGGGGGGGGTPGAANGVAGGNTTFGGWTAGGGAFGGGWNGSTGAGGAGGTNTLPGSPPSNWKRDGAFGVSGPGNFQFNPGGAGGSGPPSIPGSITAPQGRFATGAGGPGGGSGSAGGPGGGGGEGGEIIFWLAGATLTTTAYSVGAGGTGGAAGTGGSPGTAGTAGCIQIDEFF